MAEPSPAGMPLAIEGEGEGERHWHYPTNLPVRDYQLAIAETCLRHNTLVVLPTGLGKTLIASVVLFNFGRWFPGGKLVFVAPTRPLVAQQLAATQQLCASAELVELTGAQIPSERERLWGAKRLFFTTPHVLQNDLVTGSCPGGAIRLLVFDEAHRATGRHAYCEVMRRLAGSAASMRVVGLTATPAATVGGIQQLVEVLRVSRVEYRSEESPDVAPHAHRRDVRQVVVQPSEALIRVQECFERTLLGKYYSDLRRHDAIAEMPLAELQGFRLLQERDACRARLHGSPVLGVLEGSFAMLMSLATAGEILALHGIVPFVGRLQGGEEGPLRTRLRHELEAHPELLRMVKELSNEPGFVSHPKITWVERLLLGHFEDSAPDTRAVVFAADRESVKEVVARLARHAPRIRAMAFTGQTAATLASKAFAQRQQLEVLKGFRGGGYNVLVSTSIGEGGLDIGGVDLVVCYDVQSSPLPHLQQRAGQIVLLAAAGREEQRYEQMRAAERAFALAMQSPARHLRLADAPPLDIGQCIRREFVAPALAGRPGPRGRAARRAGRGMSTQSARAAVGFDAFSLEMLAACPVPKPVCAPALGPSFRIGHSSRCEDHARLVGLFRSGDGAGAAASPAWPVAETPLLKDGPSLEELMGKWADPRLAFDAADLQAFLRLTLPLVSTTKGGSSMEEEEEQQQQMVVEIPDDFFVDFAEIELNPLAIDGGALDPLRPLPVDPAKAIAPPKSPAARPIPLANDHAPQGLKLLLAPLEPVSASGTAAPIAALAIDPAPQRHQPMVLKSPPKSFSSSSATTMTPIAGKARPVVVSQTPSAASPMVLKRRRLGGGTPGSEAASVRRPRRLDARQFVESQAVDEEGHDDEEDEEGYSELGSFIDDGTQEEGWRLGSDESEHGAPSSPPDMMAFYRQSLLHSQPFGGFATGSRYVHKPAVRKPSALCSIITEDEDGKDGKDVDEDAALAGIVGWDSADDFAQVQIKGL